MFKYHVDNLALICQVCNYNDDAVVGAQFTDEMRKRHGKDFVEWVLQENNKHRGEKMELPLLVAYAEEIRNR